MDKQAMITTLAEAAGLSTLELMGFYETLEENGGASSDEIELMIAWGLPIEDAARTINLKTPLANYIPFNIVERLFEKMGMDREETKTLTKDRFFHVSAVINTFVGVVFKDHPFLTHDGQFPNRKTLGDAFGHMMQVHPSMVCILHITEMTESECKNFTS